jgi:N6-adenosine-specific RNA methylase IME4
LKLQKLKTTDEKRWKSTYNMYPEYYERFYGVSRQEAEKMVKDRQTTFSLEKCIAKHGSTEGQQIWMLRQEKWQNTLNKLPEERIIEIMQKKVVPLGRAQRIGDFEQRDTMIVESLDDAGPYEIIYTDPPWKYWGDPNKDQAAGKHYKCMSFEELAALPVRRLLSNKAVVFMWTTSSKMAEACALFEPWGFVYRGVFQVWVKTTNDNTIIHGQGVRPSFTKPTAEYLLVGSTLARGRAFPLLTEKMQNVVLAPRPGNIHSRKPDVFRDNIVSLLGDRPRLEMFARQTHDGWHSWGDELVASSDVST